MNAKHAQLSLLAVAALVALLLLASGAPAQATSTNIGPDSGGQVWLPQGGPGGPGDDPAPTPTPTPVPQQTVPEDCLTPAVSVISEGHYAIFEAYWDTEDRTLVNNPCPASVTHQHHHRSNGDDNGSEGNDSNGNDSNGNNSNDGSNGGDENHETVTRAASDADIGTTIFHIPGAADLTVSLPSTDGVPNDDQTKYGFLYRSISEDNDTRDGVVDGIDFLGPNVWTLPTCTEEGAPPSTDSLCFGFSTALLRAEDWNHLDGFQDQDYRIEYHLVAVREDDAIAPADRGHVFVLTDPDGLGMGTEPSTEVWSSYNLDDNEIRMPANDYLHPHWVFTEPGTYLLQLHAHGQPKDSLDAGADTVTSVVQTYTFHVGLFADIKVTVTAAATDDAETPPEPGDEVTITVTASNAGPDTATSPKVDVTLPDGLAYTSAQADTGTYDSDTGVWAVDDLDKDATAILTITATVADGTRGQEQTVSAEIYATEHIGSSDVVELDPRTDDNTAQAVITPAKSANVNPMFRVTRSVSENLPTGTLVGDPVAAFDSDDTELTYSLSGNGAKKFQVNGQGQISLSECGVLDYEAQDSYSLILGASDGKDQYGNTDATVDHTIGVLVEVTDVDDDAHPAPDLALRLSADNLSPALDGTVTLTVTQINRSACDETVTMNHTWEVQDPAHTGTWTSTEGHTAATREYTHATAGSRLYQVRGSYHDAEDNQHWLDSNRVVVVWQ